MKGYTKNGTARLRRGAIQEHVLMMLSEFSPLSYVEYAELAGIPEAAAHERIRGLWDAGILYVERYERGPSGKPQPLYAIGRLLDAEKPAPKTSSEKTMAYLRRLKAEGGKPWADHLAGKAKRHKERLATEPEYRAKVRAFSTAHARRKYGHKPRTLSSEKSIMLIAMQFGNTWWFDSQKRRKAA